MPSTVYPALHGGRTVTRVVIPAPHQVRGKLQREYIAALSWITAPRLREDKLRGYDVKGVGTQTGLGDLPSRASKASGSGGKVPPGLDVDVG